MSPQYEVYEYVHRVLESGDHGSYRHIPFDLPTFDDAIQQHAERIALKIEDEVKKIHIGHHDERVSLQNHLGNVSFECFESTPNNFNDLVQAVAKAKRENLNIKPIGGFYAFSPICETTGYAIKTDKLVGISITPTTSLKKPYAEGLYDVLCGTAFKQIVQTIEKDGRALMNLGGFTGQGIIGATATGTHGSGLMIPPLASMIVGIDLISAQFEEKSGLPVQYRIEPTNGITDPKLHSTSWALIQDDREFNAAMTGLGTMGIVYSVTISTVPFYWIRELRELVDWTTAKKLLEQGPQGDILKYHNAEVWVNPYTSKVLLTRREKITVPPDGELADANVHIYDALVKELPALHTVMNHIFNGSITDIIDELEKLLSIILALILRLFPLVIPSTIDLTLQSQNHSQPKVAKYYDIYDIGFSNNFSVISTEISYPMTSYLPAADATMALLQKIRKQDIHQAVVSPISLRFTASTPANLSMSYSANPSGSLGQCYIEMPSLLYFYKSIQNYEDISRLYAEESINSFQGRLHWGQYITPSFTTLQYQPHDPDFYTSIASFRTVAERFDPGHMMANNFLNKVIWLVAGV